MWSPPQVPNGVIIYYQVNYSMSGQLVTILLGNTSNYVVSDLEEYTWYTFTISSFTRIGQGPSTFVSARTDIAGMAILVLSTNLSTYLTLQHYYHLGHLSLMNSLSELFINVEKQRASDVIIMILPATFYL